MSHKLVSLYIGDGEYYTRTDVDNMIAEKDKAIDELKERNDELQKATDSAWSKVNAMYDELRHHKYKRCMAMKKMCQQAQYKYSILSQFESSQISPNPKSFKRYDSKFRFYLRMRKRWLAIAEKFKEAK